MGTNRQYGRGSVMDWAAAPIPSDGFELSTTFPYDASAPLSYVAGSPIRLHIVQKASLDRYLGLMLYAVKDPRGQGAVPTSDIPNQVGDWIIGPNDPFKVIRPIENGQNGGTCVVHSNSHLKLLHHTVFFTAPKGTGTITFRLLLKSGEQNKGFFYTPARTLTLQEGFTALPSPHQQTNLNETCAAACWRSSTVTKYCDPIRTAALNSSADITADFNFNTCLPPLVSSCDAGITPYQSDLQGGVCLVRGASCGAPPPTYIPRKHCLRGRRGCSALLLLHG